MESRRSRVCSLMMLGKLKKVLQVVNGVLPWDLRTTLVSSKDDWAVGPRMDAMRKSVDCVLDSGFQDSQFGVIAGLGAYF